MLGEKLPRPGVGMALLLVLLVLGIQVASSICLTLVGLVIQHGLHEPAPHLERQPIFLGCVNIIAFGAAVALGLHLNRLSFREAFPRRRNSMRLILGVAISVMGAGLLLSEADNIFRSVLRPPRAILDLMKELFLSQENVLARAWLLVIVAPITEELLFRGIILRGLLSKHRPATAVIITAVLFALLHLNPWQFMSAFFLGILLGWFYVRTGSLSLCIIGHAALNGMSVLFSILPWEISGTNSSPELLMVQFQAWWLDLAGLVMLLTGLWIVRSCAPREPPVIRTAPAEQGCSALPG